MFQLYAIGHQQAIKIHIYTCLC